MKLEIQKYFKISTIHGVRYISSSYHLVERIFWTIFLTSSVLYTFKLFNDLAVKMKNFPIVVYLSDKSVPVSEIYFPAVTVCPDLMPYIPKTKRNSLNQNSYYKYSKNTIDIEFYENKEDLELLIDERRLNLTYVEILRQLESGQISPSTLGLKILKRLQVIDLLKNSNIFNKLNLSLPTDDILDVMNEFKKEFNPENHVRFFWVNDDNQLLSEIVTLYGLCLTFNMAMVDDFLIINSTSNDFHLQLFYHHEMYKSVPPQYLPRRISTSTAGLYIQIFIAYENFKVVESNLDGLLVILHDPFELPLSSGSKFLIRSFQLSEIKVHPQLFSIDDSLLNYSPKDRNCYLDNEQTLKFFKKYTKANCIQECLTSFMISRCSCVEFFMIRNSTTRICSANEKTCPENAKNEFEAQQFSCGCLQPCSYVKYEFERTLESHGPTFLSREVFRLDTKVTFNSDKFNNLIYKQQFDVLDFMSYVGGLLGLFAGFSVLSFVEVAYWFSVRIILDQFNRVSTKIVPYHEEHLNEGLVTKAKKGVVNFLEESTIHGLGMIAESNVLQRFLWIFFLTISMTACSIMIYETREKIPDSRVVAFDDNFKFIDNISFPALTFVPEFIQGPEVNFKYGTIVGQVTENPPETPDDDFFRNESMDAFCDPRYDVYVDGTTYDLRPYFPGMMKAISQVQWFQKQVLTFNGKTISKFSEVVTDRGMGFSFNLINAEELLNFKTINEDFRYTSITVNKNSSLSKETIKVSNKNQAELKLNLKNHRPPSDIVCLAPSFIVHNSDELPTFFDRDHFSPVQYGMEIDIDITPEIITTDNDLKFLDPKTRECYFDGEKSLKFFKKYSHKNCLTECLANFTLHKCNCTHYNQPYDKSIFCSLEHEVNVLYCPLRIFTDYILLDLPSTNCSCLPTCDSVTYHIKYFHKFSTQSDEISINLRVNTEDAILFRRYQQFTFSDVVSYVGGLLGLFAGISMLSIVEIFYFFVIRVVVDVCRAVRGQQ